MQTAFVTQLTRAIAEQLAGVDAAAEIDALVDSGLLRRVGSAADQGFEAHGLVQQGMRTLVHSRLGSAQSRDLAERTATVLVANEQAEAAFTLLAGIGSKARIECLQQLAERYAAHGQVDLLMASIAKLPASQFSATHGFASGQARRCCKSMKNRHASGSPALTRPSKQPATSTE